MCRFFSSNLSEDCKILMHSISRNGIFHFNISNRNSGHRWNLSVVIMDDSERRCLLSS